MFQRQLLRRELLYYLFVDDHNDDDNDDFVIIVGVSIRANDDGRLLSSKFSKQIHGDESISANDDGRDIVSIASGLQIFEANLC